MRKQSIINMRKSIEKDAALYYQADYVLHLKMIRSIAEYEAAKERIYLRFLVRDRSECQDRSVFHFSLLQSYLTAAEALSILRILSQKKIFLDDFEGIDFRTHLQIDLFNEIAMHLFEQGRTPWCFFNDLWGSRDNPSELPLLSDSEVYRLYSDAMDMETSFLIEEAHKEASTAFVNKIYMQSMRRNGFEDYVRDIEYLF